LKKNGGLHNALCLESLLEALPPVDLPRANRGAKNSPVKSTGLVAFSNPGN
jgi:hypothetical protein